MHRTAAETREHVLKVTHELFYWDGIRNTGVDRVAAEAGVAPTTLYRLFGSKDDLVGAYVERADQLHREWVTATLAAAGPDVRQQILALVDGLIARVEPDRCRGCPFLMALTEFPDPGLPAHRNAVAAKEWIRDQIHELTSLLARSTPVDDPAALADQLVLVVEAVSASAQILGPNGPVRQARALVEALLSAATAGRGSLATSGTTTP